MAYDLTNRQLGDILVIEKHKKDFTTGRIIWKCKCICGDTFLAPTYTLTSKNARFSCGKCQWHIRHKDAYISWMGMKARCDDKKNKDYHKYGGKGIGYCDRWQQFKYFYQDMGDPILDNMGERLSLDRIDNNGNYCKENCRWATRSQQQLNKNPYRIIRRY